MLVSIVEVIFGVLFKAFQSIDRREQCLHQAQFVKKFQPSVMSVSEIKFRVTSVRHKDSVKLLIYPFNSQILHLTCIFFGTGKSVFVNFKTQFASKSHHTKNAMSVCRKHTVGVVCGFDNLIFHVINSSKRVDDFVLDNVKINGVCTKVSAECIHLDVIGESHL